MELLIPTRTQTEDFCKIMESRRSYRKFDTTPIPETVVQKCLDLALKAPNSSNLQPWEFYRIRTPEKKSLMVKYCFGQNAAKTAAEIIVCVARIDTWKRSRKMMLDLVEQKKANGEKGTKLLDSYYRRFVPLVYSQGPCGIFGFLKYLAFSIAGFFRLVPREPLSKKDMQIWAAKSTALACENLMLAFRAHGFDTCPMEGLDSRRVKKLLCVPHSSVITMAIAAGKGIPDGLYGEQVRFPKENFLFEI